MCKTVKRTNIMWISILSILFGAVYCVWAIDTTPASVRVPCSNAGVYYEGPGTAISVLASKDEASVMLFADFDTYKYCASVVLLADPKTGCGKLVLMGKDGSQTTLDAATLEKLVRLAQREENK